MLLRQATANGFSWYFYFSCYSRLKLDRNIKESAYFAWQSAALFLNEIHTLSTIPVSRQSGEESRETIKWEPIFSGGLQSSTEKLR